ncbi:MAG: hypothetical protein QOJ59_2436 [Thermomicrobiales bacterium]|jgi:hypothetical protein|nr:hypothetical protein [Thermomicrobiales bacterium]
MVYVRTARWSYASVVNTERKRRLEQARKSICYTLLATGDSIRRVLPQSRRGPRPSHQSCDRDQR